MDIGGPNGLDGWKIGVGQTELNVRKPSGFRVDVKPIPAVRRRQTRLNMCRLNTRP